MEEIASDDILYPLMHTFMSVFKDMPDICSQTLMHLFVFHRYACALMIIVLVCVSFLLVKLLRDFNWYSHSKRRVTSRLFLQSFLWRFFITIYYDHIFFYYSHYNYIFFFFMCRALNLQLEYMLNFYKDWVLFEYISLLHRFFYGLEFYNGMI